MNRSSVWIACLVAHLASAAPAPKKTHTSEAPPPRLITQIDLDRLGPATSGVLPVYIIQRLAFSPDENWIAVTARIATAVLNKPGTPSKVSIEFNPRSLKYRLFLVPLHKPPEQAVQIDPGIVPWFTWSPNSDSVLVEGVQPDKRSGTAKLYNLRGESLWTHLGPVRPQVISPRPVGGIFGFIGSGHLLAYRIAPPGKSVWFDTLDLNDRMVSTWKVPKDWNIADISPDGRHLAVLSGKYATKTVLVDYDSKQTLQTWENPSRVGPAFFGGFPQYFVDGGKAICSIGPARGRYGAGAGPDYTSGATHAQCRDVETGVTIATFSPFLGGAPAAAAVRASRLVLTQATFLSQQDPAHVQYYGGRVVWDFRTNEEVAAWGPAAPKAASPNAPLFLRSPVPGPVAISPTGQFVAEGADNVLRIYAIPE